LADSAEALWLGVGEWAQENRIDDTEDGGVRANSERERDHGDERECRGFSELA